MTAKSKIFAKNLVKKLAFMLPPLEYNNRVYVRGHKYVLGPTQSHFKMSLRRAQNIKRKKENEGE